MRTLANHYSSVGINPYTIASGASEDSGVHSTTGFGELTIAWELRPRATDGRWVMLCQATSVFSTLHFDSWPPAEGQRR